MGTQVEERDAPSTGEGINAYATLLTRPSYLAGATLLAYTLHKYSPNTPLIILYTPETLPEPSVKALKAEAKYSNAVVYPVEHLRLPKNDGGEGKGGGMVAERFIDTWTKLRVFEVLDVNIKDQKKKVERLCFLDADMMIFSDPSPLIFSEANDAYLHGDDGDSQNHRLCATHTCVCNLDHDSWAPSDWTPQNCAYTHLTSPNDLAAVKSTPETMSNFNSGAFLFNPSHSMREFVLSTFRNTPPATLHALKFPDQDFLNMVFDGTWSTLSWRCNALKTWRYWHPAIWRDDAVAVLHYIVDKPWAARVSTSSNGELVAGYKGDDGVTHSWWWKDYEEWHGRRDGQGEKELLQTVGKYVAGDGNGEASDEMRAIGGGAQEYAKKWEGKEEGKDAEKDGEHSDSKGGEEEQSTHGPVLRKKMLGERGHGPVIRPQGRSFMDP
jgi:inositol 3-alpha-galactosyltransferase